MLRPSEGRSANLLFNNSPTKFVTYNTFVEDTVDAFLGSCCAHRPLCEDTTLVLGLFVVMPHEQSCDVTAAWDDERKLFFGVDCRMVESTSYSQKALFIHTGVQLSQRTVSGNVFWQTSR